MALDPKVKLLCSFGGKILPRPGDSALRYAGGHTRILSLRRSATLADLLAKIGQIVAGPVTVKYQLPDEELDALISITTDEDLDNMMEEFDRIADAAGPDGSARMRIFLFSQADVDSSGEAAAGTDTGQIYVDAINGIGLLPRRDSLVSASSNEGMSPSTMSPSNGSNTQDPARSGLGLLRDETLAPTSSRVVEPLPLPQQQQAKDFNPPQNAVNVVNMAVAHQFAYPIYSGNAALMIPVAGNFGPKLEHLVVAGDNVNAIEGNLGPNQGKVEAFVEESLYRSDQSSNNETVSSGNGNVNGNGGNKDISQQPLSQLPPLHPTHFQQPQGAYIPSLMPCPQLALRLDDCQMCQRALLHAHSDTVITNSHANGNGNGSGSNAIHEVRPVLQTCHSEDPKRLQASLRPESAAVEPKVESAAVVPGQFSCQSENERAFHPNVEALDHVKVLQPNGVTGVADLSTLHAPPRIVNGVMVDSEAKVETLPTGGQSAASGFTEEIMHPHDKERLLLHPNIEAFDHAKVLHPHNAVSGALADNVMEFMVDNMAASAQFASYGFTQIPRMLQPHDNDRLLVRSNMPSVVGLPVDLQTSYAMVANPSQCYLPDPFQPLLQNTAPPCHLAKQDMATRQNVSVVKNGNYHATEPPNRVSVPEIPYDFARPINGTMESLCGSTIGPLGTTGHQIAAAAVNGGLPMLKLENSTLLLENNHVVRPHVGGNMVFLANSHFMSGVVSKENYTKPIHKPPPPSTDMVPEHPAVSADNAQVFRSQAGVNALCLGNAFIASRIVPEGNSIRPIHEAPPSLEFSRLQSLQPSETSKASNMTANQGPLISYNQEVRIQPEVPNERLLVMPTYSCGTTAAYTNMNASNVVPIGGQKDEASWFRSNDTVDNAAVSLNSTSPVHCSKFGSSNVHIEQFQGPTPLNSLFCNQDPQKIMGSVQMVPPRMNKVPSKEFVAPKDASTENHLVNIKGSDVAVHAEESGFHHMQNSTNKEPCTGPVRFIQGEDHSKQEVQGSAEQVAAPVLQPSIPPAPVTFPRERTGADLPSSKESGFGETIAVVQSTAAIADHKTEGVTAKQAVNTNFGFPIKDDIGRLQIIKNSDLEELRELGSGTFGTVYHGKWRGSDVAIKRINNRCFAGELSEQPMRDDFWNEARKLADMHHPNVVAFYGVVLDGPGGTVATVTEFMVNGSLRRALQKNDKSLDRRKRLLIAMDVAFGMEYLHGKNIIHFDLKSDNLLVNLRDPQRPICKVADLGLSKVKCQTLISGGVRGTLPWMAPELLNGDNTLVSDKVDVFSFGIVMWELLTGEEPYADLHYGAIIGGIVSNTLRPPVPESCDPEWRSLMEHCWSPEPSERPNFTEIASRLRSMAASYPQK